MARRLSVLLLAMLFSGAVVATAQQSGAQPSQTPKIKKVPIQPTNAGSGQEMYHTYCASCHGVDGKGNGPAAPALKIPPTDLTLLSSHNRGSFPDSHVESVLKFGTSVPGHGSADMPVWGDLMGSMCGPSDRPAMTQLRIRNITDYVKSLQKK